MSRSETVTSVVLVKAAQPGKNTKRDRFTAEGPTAQTLIISQLANGDMLTFVTESGRRIVISAASPESDLTMHFSEARTPVAVAAE